MFKNVKVGGRGAADVLVLGHFEGAALDATTKGRDIGGVAAAAAKRTEATGSLGSIAEAFPAGKAKSSPERIVLVGLGKKEDFNAASLRDAGAAVGRRLAAIKASRAEVDLGGPIKAARADAGAAGSAFAESVGLLAWNTDAFKGSATSDPKRPTLSLTSSHAAFTKGMERGLAIAESVNFTRTLSETPPNICNPTWLASEVKKMARATGLKCTVISGKKLLDENLVGIHTVGDASDHKGCLIRLEYTPQRASARSKPVVLVGKTMTYDSGGLSIKPSAGMAGMKRDMDGGAAVIGAMHAIATTIKPRKRVVALLACAENSISDEAYRPDDVLTFRNGVTVEVTNTDAEGRLVLADALCWACDNEDPASIIDMATLTGGVVVALGSVYAGLWCDDAGLRGQIDQAACDSGELVWRLPHHAEYKKLMKSSIADILNSAPVREAHPIQGAAFLAHFVKDGIPWAHIDIAGVHATKGDKGPFISGPTGFGVRLIASMLDR